MRPRPARPAWQTARGQNRFVIAAKSRLGYAVPLAVKPGVGKDGSRMAVSQSATFAAEPDKVWGTVVKLVTGAGYAVVKTDRAAMHLVYQAKGGAWAWAQNVHVSVSSVDEGETMVTVFAEAAGEFSFTEGALQRKLIGWVIDELSDRFDMIAMKRPKAAAPGTSGCAGFILLFATFTAGFCIVAGFLARG